MYSRSICIRYTSDPCQAPEVHQQTVAWASQLWSLTALKLFVVKTPWRLICYAVCHKQNLLYYPLGIIIWIRISKVWRLNRYLLCPPKLLLLLGSLGGFWDAACSPARKIIRGLFKGSARGATLRGFHRMNAAASVEGYFQQFVGHSCCYTPECLKGVGNKKWCTQCLSHPVI